MLYNCHTHTFRSHDSTAPINDVIEAAINGGLSGVIFTDHCDCEYHKTLNIEEQFNLCESDILAAREVYGDRIKLLFGIELGESVYAPDFAKKILSAHDYDAVLLSVHSVRIKDYDMPFATIDFSKLSDEFIDGYLKKYFEDMLESVNSFDFDILSHLTVPLRYIELKYGREINIERHYPAIETILKEIITQEKALEINTSSVEKDSPIFFPDENIIDLYLSLGGKYFTLGSDSHTAKGVTKGLKEACRLLKSKGVTELCYYEGRKRVIYEID
ncbi:MAG: histidinol-phosphatase HisJ family protein [Oscillospiraceae bacterium]|nr:histidinol-phosphatase HisJ family protein [Oscillospiraceae bacterium]